jgi:enoyl-CoA hydratase/carnithine racemase
MNRLAVIKEAIGSAPYTKIEVERKEEVATIWLNSPKDLNALSQEMLGNITSAIVSLN